MGGNVRCHADRDTGGAVEQKVRHLGGQDGGFVQGAVIVGTKIDGILVNVCQKLPGKAGHAHFCVTHGCRRVAVNGTEVALAVHQGIAHAEILGQTDKGVVHGAVAMGMVFTYDVTNDASRLLVRPVVDVAEL